MKSTFTSTTAAVIAPANVYRKHLIIHNSGHGGGSATLYVLLGDRTTVSATNYTVEVEHKHEWRVPEGFVGVVQGILASNGGAQVTEVNETNH
jgi:hypothetical protein